MLNILAYVRAKFKEAVLAGVQDALDEIDPLSSRRGPEDGDGPAAVVPITPRPPTPPALGAAEPASGDAVGEQEQVQPAPSMKQQIAQAAAAAASNAISTAVSPASGPSAPRRDRRPRGENGP